MDFAYDCISEGESVKKAASTLKEGGKVAIVGSREGRGWAASEDGLSTEPVYGVVGKLWGLRLTMGTL